MSEQSIYPVSEDLMQEIKAAHVAAKLYIDQLEQRIGKLENALRGLLSVDNTEDDLHGNVYCLYCSESGDFGKVQHTPDCPVLVARALLGEDGQG